MAFRAIFSKDHRKWHKRVLRSGEKPVDLTEETIWKTAHLFQYHLSRVWKPKKGPQNAKKDSSLKRQGRKERKGSRIKGKTIIRANEETRRHC